MASAAAAAAAAAAALPKTTDHTAEHCEAAVNLSSLCVPLPAHAALLRALRASQVYEEKLLLYQLPAAYSDAHNGVRTNRARQHES